MVVALQGGVTDLEGGAAPALRSVSRREDSERPLRMAVFAASPLSRSLLITLAGQIGWTGHAFDRFDEVRAAIAAAQVELLVFSLPDVPVPYDELEALLATLEAPAVALVDDLVEQKAALRLGASLAVQEPFDPEFLALSMQALVRRRRPLHSVLSQTTRLFDLTVRLANHTIERAGRRQVLSPTEWQLFAFLLAHPGHTFSRDQLVEGAWDMRCGGRRAQIDLYVYRLRRKIERDPRRPEIIKTVRHEGYRLNTMHAAPISLAAAQPA